MSTQSGISASAAVIDSFNRFISSGSERALILKIENENIVIDIVLSGTSSFSSDWKELQAKLPPNEARYIFVKNDSVTPAYYVFISYVPDYANVRSKMIYASTKNTLLLQLGHGEIVKKNYSVNDIDDISYKAWQDFERSEKTAAPLTASEMSLKQINESEVNTLLYNDTGSSSTIAKRSLLRMDHSSNMKSTPVEPEVFEKLVAFNTPESVIRTKLNSTETVYLHDSESNVVPEKVPDVIAKVEGPQFVFYKNKALKTFFIYSCPSGSKIRDRMLYASTKQGYLAQLKEQGIVVHKVIEVGDSVEIEISDLKDEMTLSSFGVDSSSVTGKVTHFSKPRGPRRR